MGLSIQNVGIESRHVPEHLAAVATGDAAALPQLPGWTWVSLTDAVDEPALDALVTRLAESTNARAVAFSVDDSDTAYVVGAAPRTTPFRLHVNPTPEETQDVEEAAAFAGVAAEQLAVALAQSYLYAEQGVHLLLAQMRLLRRAPEPVLTTDDTSDQDDEPEEAADLVAAIRENQRGCRWVAEARLPFPGRWIVVAAERASGGVASSFCSRGDRIEIVDVYPTVSALRRDLERPDSGVELGDWHEVPPDVPRSLNATTAWALSTISEHP